MLPIAKKNRKLNFQKKKRKRALMSLPLFFSITCGI